MTLLTFKNAIVNKMKMILFLPIKANVLKKILIPLTNVWIILGILLNNECEQNVGWYWTEEYIPCSEIAQHLVEGNEGCWDWKNFHYCTRMLF